MMKFAVVLWCAIVVVLLCFKQSYSSTTLLPDTLRILAIRVEFQPDASENTTGDGTFDQSESNDPFQIDPPPHSKSYFEDHLEFAKNYFWKISRGILLITGKIFPVEENQAYRLDHRMNYYNANTTPSEINQGLAKLLQDAIQKADLMNPEINFSHYDGYIVFHAGVGKDVDLGFDETPQDIPSLFITQKFLQENLGVNGISVDNDSTLVRNGIILPETESQDGIELGLNGIVVSNIASQLGWLDLFSPVTRRSGVGRFSVMDAGLFNGDGLLPALPDAWTRIDAGWETAQTIYQAQDDEFTVNQVQSNSGTHVYRLPINENEYFLLEERYAGNPNLDSLQFELGAESGDFPNMKEVLKTYLADKAVFSDRGVLVNIDNFDRGLPGSGILIWHIDENVINQNRATNQINADPDHRGVDLEEADGSQDIGQIFDVLSGGSGSEIGTALDLWYRDNSAPLYQQNPANEFSLKSVPNSRSYYNRANSHIKISDFSNRDSVMTFKAEINFFQQNFPRKLDSNVYGKITSLKTTDLNSDGKAELIFITDQNRILIVDANGQSVWGSDSLQIAQIAESVIPDPAIFSLPDGNKGLVVTTREGLVFGWLFNRVTMNILQLFPPIQSPDSITTFPIVEYDWQNSVTFPEVIELDSLPKIYWGCRDGNVYELMYENGTWQQPDIFATIGEPVSKLHFTEPGMAIVIGESGKVYGNNNAGTEIGNDLFQPVGYNGITIDKNGFFFELLDRKYDHPEDGIHYFEANPIAIATALDPLATLYLIPGQNHLKIFNYNFTLIQNYPVKIFNPDREVSLSIPALVGPFPTVSKDNDLGVVIVDPEGGGISGFDLKGNSLPDFPLAVGEKISVSPAILDIDGDGDIELACVSENGTVYVWDFYSVFGGAFGGESYRYWLQSNANEMNQNRHAPNTSFRIPSQTISSTSHLLPESKVYNWPNPNLDDYTFIRYYLNSSANVKIKIYDLAGDLVKQLDGPGNPATDNEVRWDLTNVQSGVYLARIEASGNGKTETRFIKIAVVK
jgi:M6 family metalloprotease-like protein